MTKAWKAPVFVLATIWLIIDAVCSYFTRPIADWLGKQRFLARVRRWVSTLGPYQSLALFAVPVIVLEPAKPLSAYLIATGHFFAGAVIFITAEVVKLTVVERLFHLNKDKLLSIRIFAAGYGYWRTMIDLLESTAVWRASKQLMRKASDWISEFWARHAIDRRRTADVGPAQRHRG